MCGIAGILSQEPNIDTDILKKMTSVIEYRGPDGAGHMVLENGTVGLAHRRLSILDTREIGGQPMVSTCGGYWIVFNGEIYNYIELKNQLSAAGYTFKTETDTEVLLVAYGHWGEDCLDHFIGMFSFAIWDMQKKILFAARDRLGIKPFYYRFDRNRLLFASEIKSLHVAENSAPSVDPTLIDAYMGFGYVPGENTLFASVKRLLPGHKLTCRPGEAPRIAPYWSLDFTQDRSLGFGDHADSIDKLLQDSVALRLRSDVPLGVFLSGGLDSSAVVALLAPGAAKGLKTFSVSYDFGPAYDETPYAREVSQRFQTDHHEIRMTPQSFVDFIPDYIRHMDEPVTEAAAISLYYVSKLAREQVVVCLSGEGSDELFAGYDFYGYNLAIERLRNVFGSHFSGVLAKLGRRLSRSQKLHKYLKMAEVPLDERYKGISSYDDSAKDALYHPEFQATAAHGNSELESFIEGLFKTSRNWDPLSRMLYFDTRTWLVDDLLIKADRMSMATSIELRVPFLDHRLVEYAATLPSEYKLKGRKPKYILKKILENRIPQTIINRKKMGFPTPLEMMFRGDLYDYARDTLLSAKALQRGYFSGEIVAQLLDDHKQGKVDRHREIWQLLVLEEWHLQHNLN